MKVSESIVEHNLGPLSQIPPGEGREFTVAGVKLAVFHLRDGNIYATESDVTEAVRAWCCEHGGNRQLRIALCGYAGEGHETLEQAGWTRMAWKAQGGYGLKGDDAAGRENATRERIWFSPYCVPPAQLDFFETEGTTR